jgi:uncharacterized protein (DUF1810 family)
MAIDQYELNRFIAAQLDIYAQVISELKSGHKQSHWMWFIFPQIQGLGSSRTAKHYAIRDLQEANEYLSHPIPGLRLIECSEIILNIKGLTASNIFGYPDDVKLKSSMTLFAAIENTNPIFEQVLDKYFDGSKDNKTLEILDTL